MKKFFVPIFAILLFSLSGCASLNHGISINADGSVFEVVEVALSQNELSSSGVDANKVLTETESVMKNALESVVAGRKIDGFSYQFSKQNFSLTLSLNFSSTKAYQSFWQIENEETETEEEFHFFYNTQILSRATLFKGAKTSQIAQHMQKFFEENFPNFSFSDSDFKFGYVWGVLSALGYRSNADKVVTQNGTDYHIWQTSLAEEKEAVVYVNLVKAENVACMLIFVLFLTFLFGIFLYFRFKEKIPQRSCQKNKKML